MSGSKKRLAALLALVLVATLFPTMVFAMQLFVKTTVDGYITLEVEPTDRIEGIREKVYDAINLPIENQVLTYAGKELEDGQSLQDYSIAKDSTIHLVAKDYAGKTLRRIAPLSAITGVVNGAAKTAAALGLPEAVTLATDDSDEYAAVDWDIEASDYDPSGEREQTFMVDGAVILPEGVANLRYVPLSVSVSVTVSAKPAPPQPPKLYWHDAGSNYVKATNTGLKFTVEKDYALLQDVKVDGAPLTADDYKAESGSTIVTLHGAYLENLPVGAHSLLIGYTDGVSVESQFTVEAAAAGGDSDTDAGDDSDADSADSDSAADSGGGNPRTGDDGNLPIWIELLCVSAIGIILASVHKRRGHK
jgi:hypothetical protein